MVLRISAFLLVSVLFSCEESQSGTEAFTEATDNRTPMTGKELFGIHCSNCHGMDGKLGNSGAKDLSQSTFSDEEIMEIITEGKKAMPPLGELIGEPKDIDSVTAFVKTLRK